MRCIFLTVLLLFFIAAAGQSITPKLTAAFRLFEHDAQLKSAIASLYVVDAATGKVVFDKASRTGLAPASTQKIITAAAAYELLGHDFRYQTRIGYYGTLKGSQLSGALYIKPSGDPTLGSWRWKQTTDDSVLQRVLAAIAATGIKRYGSILVDNRGWEAETIPGGWPWDDIGNYYGAGAAALNWHENQYDLYLKSGTAVGDKVIVTGTKPSLYNYDFTSALTAAAKGSGDNAYIYFAVGGSAGVVRGTIPAGEEQFVISGAMPAADKQFLATLNDSLSNRGINKEFMNGAIDRFSGGRLPDSIRFFHTETSPSLDSICYWFLKRSINLYGEALAKTIALKAGATAGSEEGATTIRNFWVGKKIGIDGTELNMKDGSGLSPLNRITTHAQVSVLQYAKALPWWESYFAGFPEYNGMKLKSGTISGVKSFCGYHVSKSGHGYFLAFIVNNYNGSSGELVKKIYAVLDVLK